MLCQQRQETKGNIRKREERKRKREETRGNEFCSSHFCSNGTLLERVAESDFVVLPFCAIGSWIMVCKGWSVEDDLSKALWKRILMGPRRPSTRGPPAQRVPAPNERLQQKKVPVKDRAKSGLSRSLRLPQPQARVRVLRNQRQKLRRSWPSWSLHCPHWMQSLPRANV